MKINSADPDQTVPFLEQSDQGLHCLLRPFVAILWVISEYFSDF